MRSIKSRFGLTTIGVGDRLVWNAHKWFIVDFAEDNDVVVRLEGTPDVATLPDSLVAELVGEYRIWQCYYLR